MGGVCAWQTACGSLNSGVADVRGDDRAQDLAAGGSIGEQPARGADVLNDASLMKKSYVEQRNLI